MKKLFPFLLLLLISLHVAGQETRTTTFIIVRHAEKGNDGTKDPELAAEGVDRANRLSQLLKDVSVSAIYSTNFKRTKNTVAPLSTAKAVNVELYESLKSNEIDAILKKHAGGTIVICGHSNTVPPIVNQLIGKDQFKNLEDSEYGALFIVSVSERGKSVSVVQLHY